MDSSALRQELARLRSELDETHKRLATADRSAKERDDVLRTLSHDMRTPLSSRALCCRHTCSSGRWPTRTTRAGGVSR